MPNKRADRFRAKVDVRGETECWEWQGEGVGACLAALIGTIIRPAKRKAAG